MSEPPRGTATRRTGWMGLGVLVAAAAYDTLGVQWWRSRQGLGLVAWDFYGYFYPNVLYAWRSLWHGHGLLWNPHQACGQPFFAISQTGLLYPFYAAYWFLEREPAHLLTIGLHLVITGLGAYLLGRSAGLGTIGSLTGALAFQLGWSMRQLAAWAPMQLASYTWMPVALWRTERLIRAPTPRQAVVLAAVIALQLLPGFPQLVFLTYQLIALRIAWAVVFAETSRRRPLVLAATGALVLAPLLVGVQLVPSMEVWRESARAGAVPLLEIGPGFTWPQLLEALRSYAGLPASWWLLAFGLCALGAPRARRRRAIFWWAVAAGYVVLSLGPGSLLFAVYERLPLGSAFRGSARLLWVVALALAMAAALGAEEIVRRLPRRLGWVAPAMVVAAIVLANFPPIFGQRRGDIYGAHRDVFVAVRERATPQDRTLIVGKYPDTSLMPKSAALFDVADVFDFEPLAARVYADFFTYLRTGRPSQTFADWIWVHENTLLPTLQRPLFDLTAARYLLVAVEVDRTSAALPTGLRLLGERDGVRLYENEQALPRARWIPTIRVVTDKAAVLPALAAAAFDVRHAAIVDHAPASGFLGSDTAETGSATVVVNDPERLVVHVRAPTRGFLFLADTFYPGWTARVGGRPVEILRADGAFRAVEVPAGEAEVEFAYRPRSLLRGAALSVGGALVALALLWRG